MTECRRLERSDRHEAGLSATELPGVALATLDANWATILDRESAADPLDSRSSSCIMLKRNVNTSV
jgi:hypothetical protein